MVTYDGDDMVCVEPVLNLGEKMVILITHDESTFYCNEGKKMLWMENGKHKLLPKGNGASIMRLGFVCDCHGFMSHTKRWEDGHATKRSSYQLFNAGANREGWLGTVRRRCTAGELHPGCDIVLSFDNSMTHHKK